jgi:uncharacterized membrane protein YfcA
MGGGSLMTPVLVLFLGFSPITAIGTDILHGAIFKSVGAVRQRRLGNVKARLSGWMLLGSAPMSLVGVGVAALLAERYGDDVEAVGGQVLGAALLVGGLGLIAKNLFHYSGAGQDSFSLTTRDRVIAVLIGLFGGFIVGLTSVGSGVFFGLTMLLVYPLKSAKVVGTDIFHAAALLWVAGVGHLAVGDVDLPAVGWLLLGSIPGILIGSQGTVAVSERLLRTVLAATLTLAGLSLLGVPGLRYLIPAAVGAGTLVVAAGLLPGSRLGRWARSAGGSSSPSREGETEGVQESTAERAGL